MNQQKNDHSVLFIKRLAKSIKKSQKISHAEALNKASINCGFQNWNHFLNARDKNKLKEPRLTQSNRKISSAQFDSKILSTITPYRNLLIAGINELVKSNSVLMKLDNTEDTNEEGHLFTKVLGYPSVILWREISYQELEIAVWWKYNHDLNPNANLSGNAREQFQNTEPIADEKHYKKFVGAVLVGWLERREGVYLQGTGNEGILRKYLRRGEKAELEKYNIIESTGFEPTGLFYK